jgi:hypothetical protein
VPLPAVASRSRASITAMSTSSRCTPKPRYRRRRRIWSCARVLVRVLTYCLRGHGGGGGGGQLFHLPCSRSRCYENRRLYACSVGMLCRHIRRHVPSACRRDGTRAHTVWCSSAVYDGGAPVRAPGTPAQRTRQQGRATQRACELSVSARGVCLRHRPDRALCAHTDAGCTLHPSHTRRVAFCSNTPGVRCRVGTE